MAMKEVLEVAAAIAGLLTAIIPLIGRFLDWRKRKTRLARRARRPSHADRPPLDRGKPSLLFPETANRLHLPEPVVLELAEEPEWEDESIVDVLSLARARSLVKGPAIALLVAGGLGLCFNLVVATVGFIDELVTPLTTENRERHNAGKVVPLLEAERGQRNDDEERTNAALGFVTLLILCVPCAMAIWAGVNMIRLRNYWLSVAGSIAIMPGACFCCLAGFPVGIWSLVILFRPEVSSAFT